MVTCSDDSDLGAEDDVGVEYDDVETSLNNEVLGADDDVDVCSEDFGTSEADVCDVLEQSDSVVNCVVRTVTWLGVSEGVDTWISEAVVDTETLDSVDDGAFDSEIDEEGADSEYDVVIDVNFKEVGFDVTALELCVTELDTDV